MKLEKKLISLKSAKNLKELGFNIPTYYAYSPLGHIYCCGDLVDYNNYEDVLEWTSIPSLEDLLIFLDKYDFSLLYSADTEGWYFLTIALDNNVIFGKENPNKEDLIVKGMEAIINYEYKISTIE